MKPIRWKLVSLVSVCLIFLGAVVAIIHSCGTGYYLNPKTVPTTAPTAPPGIPVYEPYSVSWQSGVDFTQGEFDGVAVSPSGGGLQLGVGGSQNFTPTQICVAAASANAVWLHNLDDPGNVSKTIIAPLPKFGSESQVNPSRTAIDMDGNCWVGGRGNGGVYKISKTGEIKGKVQITFSGSNGVPNTRALAIDKNGFVWAGNYGDGKVYKIGPGEDADGNLTILASYSTTDDTLVLPTPTTLFPSISPINKPGPYGAAVDSIGNLWVAGYENNDLSPGYVSKIDTTTGNVQCTMRTNIYGIVIGKDNYPWLGGYDGGTLSKIKTNCSGFEFIINIRTWKISRDNGATWQDENGDLEITSTSSLTRGVGLDNDYYIWVADSQYNYVYKFSDNGDYMGKVATKGSNPIGVSGDPNKDANGVPLGRIWAVNNGGSVARIMGKTISVTGDNASLSQAFASGAGAYSYSDMVGFGLFTTVLKDSGSWRVKFDSGYDTPHWRAINWHAKVSDLTQVRVRVRTAGTEADIESAVWTNYFATSPGLIIGLVPDSRWAQVEIYFYTLDARYSPILDDLSLSFDLPNG